MPGSAYARTPGRTLVVELLIMRLTPFRWSTTSLEHHTVAHRY